MPVFFEARGSGKNRNVRVSSVRSVGGIGTAGIQISVDWSDFADPIMAKEIRDMLQAVTIHEGRQVKAEYRKLLSHFSPKNRPKIRTKSGSTSRGVTGMAGTYSAHYYGDKTSWSIARTGPRQWTATNTTDPKIRSAGSIYTAVGIDTFKTPLVWLEAGTQVRYRTMSSDWQSKTSPAGGTSIGPGKGMAMGWGLHAGIAPRYFRDDIISRRYPHFVSRASSKFAAFFAKRNWT